MAAHRARGKRERVRESKRGEEFTVEGRRRRKRKEKKNKEEKKKKGREGKMGEREKFERESF